MASKVHTVTFTDGDGNVTGVAQVPVTLLADGTSCMVLDPSNVTYNTLTTALERVAPAANAPMHLRHAWHWVRASMSFAESKCLQLSKTAWHRPEMVNAADELAQNGALLAAAMAACRPQRYPARCIQYRSSAVLTGLRWQRVRWSCRYIYCPNRERTPRPSRRHRWHTGSIG